MFGIAKELDTDLLKIVYQNENLNETKKQLSFIKTLDKDHKYFIVMRFEKK